MALCTDAVIRDGGVVGDPTECALVVLAEKRGVDVTGLRQNRPRRLEVTFDSGYKFMATFHDWTGDSGEEVVLPFGNAARWRFDEENASLAGQGMRVVALRMKDFPADAFQAPGDPRTSSSGSC
ncbi:hypothetical protein [Streptomyces zhihengii]|uniref:hypothetical protein n=1 Tax=Streptomyces zhihengii TaxID=1818004 RepID=UPI0033B9A1D5